jgi:hypothetical protein
MNPALFSFNLLDTEVLLCEIEAIIKRHCAESGVTTAIFLPGELRKCFSVDSIIEIKNILGSGFLLEVKTPIGN